MPSDIFGVSSADNTKLRTKIYFRTPCFVQGKQISFLTGLLICVNLVVVEISIEHKKFLAFKPNLY